MSENQTIKTIWLKNLASGVIYEIPEDEIKIFQQDKDRVVVATPDEVKDWQEGTYWDKREAEKANPTVPEVQSPAQDPAKLEDSNPPADLNDLINKTKAELLVILNELDPENKLDDKAVKADIVEAIQFFRAEKETK